MNELKGKHRQKNFFLFLHFLVAIGAYMSQKKFYSLRPFLVGAMDTQKTILQNISCLGGA